MQISLSPEVLINKRLYVGMEDSKQVPRSSMQNSRKWKLHEIAFFTVAITYMWNSQISVHEATP